MSRAFVKEDADNEDVLVPQRAPLPDGVPNEVTPRGLALLEREHEDLTRDLERRTAHAGEAQENTRDTARLRRQLDDLEARLASARLVPPPSAPTDEVRLGATVTARSSGGEEFRFRIVGVDEADPLEGLVAFTAPTAAAVLGRTVHDRVSFEAGGEEHVLDIVSVAYEDG